MQNYLRNKKGFYEAEVYHGIQYNGKRAEVKYKVDPGQQYAINEIEYSSVDKDLAPLVDELSNSSLLKKGDPIDAYTFDLEKQRLVNELQNRGYANFNLNYVNIVGDSTELDHAIDIEFEILPPANAVHHKRYRIGQLEVFTDFHQFQNMEDLVDEKIFDKDYYRQSKKFLVKPKVIDRKIFLKPFELYRAENYYKTIRKLFSLDTYRFVKLNPTVNAEADSIIDYRIYLTPQNSKWIFDLGTDFFYSNISRADRNNVVGLGVGVGLENRNTLGGSELFKASLESGIELDAKNGQITTLSLGLNNSLDIPKFSTKPFNTLRFLNKIGVIKDKALTLMEDEGISRVSFGINFLDIFDRYQVFSINTNYGYEIPINRKNRVVFNQIGFNYTTYETQPAFQPFLDANPAIDSSFQNSFFSGLIFKDLTYYYQTDKPATRSNWAFIGTFELSGLEVHLANKLRNAVSGQPTTWKVNQVTDFEKFVKLNLDVRWYKQIYRKSTLAARIRSGIALPYGEDRVVSFIKQYLVGGPGSIRAWRPMELGPGAYVSQDSTFFQRGDITFEFSTEYRFDLFWLLEGALFIDGGNIWTTKRDNSRPGSQFGSQFLDQIALGYGFGLRFDFSYFIIRFDFGFKWRNPVPLSDGSHWIPLKGQGLFDNPNVAVNYPF